MYGKPTAREPTEVKSIQGYSVTLYCPMGGYPLENPVWKKDGRELSSTSKATLHFPNIDLSDKGVSELEKFMDYFALPGRSCKHLNFPTYLH